ncbi:MAG: hypothetical protein MR025_06900 [Helicobacter trogontum]|uniref:Trigger factor C-terminal domain-containing protein n=1 Tax=Helicobacter trogontum TaxID=50960 RepID=A0A4U8SWS7_9HELI|nr:hypothetical protein [Helicobacter trogontum]MCI5787159.1 hypothetical protein [Helicobacter trogontum]TLD91394.1 hypothetical protein LS80_011270 [Helicobacter trogontum]
MRESYREEAQKSIKLTFIIDTFAKKDNVSANENELYQVAYYEAMIISIKGEQQEHIERSFTQNIAKDIDIFVANNHTITTNSSIFLNANKNMTLESKKHLTLHSYTSDISVATDMVIQANNTLNFI